MEGEDLTVDELSRIGSGSVRSSSGAVSGVSVDEAAPPAASPRPRPKNKARTGSRRAKGSGKSRSRARRPGGKNSRVGNGSYTGGSNYRPNSPSAAACSPPPSVDRINVNVHHRRPNGRYVMLDATPLTCSKEFCKKVGFPTRACCPLGQEGSSLRPVCEAMAMGVDPSDGTPGPRWSFSGNSRVEKNSKNPYLGEIYNRGGIRGRAFACSNRQNICGSRDIP